MAHFNKRKEILDEYLLTFDNLTDKLERLDQRIEELASEEAYQIKVKKLCWLPKDALAEI